MSLLLSLIIGSSPWFMAAETSDPVDYTGYQARVQFRSAGDILSLHTWVGGWLSDGTFIQSGITQAATESPTGLVFFAHQTLGGDLVTVYDIIPVAELGTWWTVGATYNASHHDWVGYYFDPEGVRHILGTLVTPEDSLVKYLAVTEPWADSGTQFATQAVRNVQGRTRAGGWVTPRLYHAAMCDHANVYSLTPGSIVWKWSTDRCPPGGFLW